MMTPRFHTFPPVCSFSPCFEQYRSQINDIVKLTIYVLDKSAYKRNAKEIGAVYREFFGRHYPAMTLLEVQGLYDDDQGCLMEIEAVAVVD